LQTTKSRLGWLEPAVQQAPENVCLLGGRADIKVGRRHFRL
jgi:hypothetical protein